MQEIMIRVDPMFFPLVVAGSMYLFFRTLIEVTGLVEEVRKDWKKKK